MIGLGGAYDPPIASFVLSIPASPVRSPVDGHGKRRVGCPWEPEHDRAHSACLKCGYAIIHDADGGEGTYPWPQVRNLPIPLSAGNAGPVRMRAWSAFGAWEPGQRILGSGNLGVKRGAGRVRPHDVAAVEKERGRELCQNTGQASQGGEGETRLCTDLSTT